MASNSKVFSLVTGYAGFFLVLLNSTPAAKTIACRVAGFTTPTQYDESRMTKTHYSDEDGEASESSLREFSDKWQRVAIGLFSVIGLEISLGLAIITTAHAGIEDYVVQSWLQVAVWVSSYFGFENIKNVEARVTNGFVSLLRSRYVWSCSPLLSSLSPHSPSDTLRESSRFGPVCSHSSSRV